MAEAEQLELAHENSLSLIYYRPDLTINARWMTLISADSLSASLLVTYHTVQDQVQLFHFEWSDPLEFLRRLAPSLPMAEPADTGRQGALTLRLHVNPNPEDLSTSVFSAFARVKGLYRGAAETLLGMLEKPPQSEADHWQSNPWIAERTIELPAPRWTPHPVNDQRLTDCNLSLTKQLILAAGLHPEARRKWWPILLGLRGASQTEADYQARLADGEEEYWELVEQADELYDAGDAATHDLYRRIDKDVYRCDRQLPLFSPHTADPERDLQLPGLQSLRRILRAHAILDPELEYAQGMADLTSPLLLVMEGDETETFLLLTRLMQRQRGLFLAGGEPVHRRLGLLWAMLCTIDPQLADYLACAQDGGKLFFSYRWLLVWFRREWPIMECLKLWDRLLCEPNYDLYLSLAIYSLIGLQRVKPRFDELFQLFTEQVGLLSVDEVLKRASQFHQHFVIYQARYQLDPDLAELYS